MSAAENIVSTVAPVPCCEPIEVELGGSKDLRRMLAVHRSRYGVITIYVRPQRPKKPKRSLDRGWFEAVASISVGRYDAREIQIDIRYYKGKPSIWIGHVTWLELLPAEADELAAKFGFPVRRESCE